MKAYSAEFRRDVLAACDAGGGTRAVAWRFTVSESWVRRIKQERRESGKVAPCRTKKRIPAWMPEAERIRQATAEKPDRTLLQLKAHLQTELSVQTLCRALKALKLTFKKKS
jgi:transposase